MAEVKVITVQAGEEFLAALTKLLGSDVAAQVQNAVNEATEGVVEVEEPDFDVVEEPVGDECPLCCCSECQGEEEEEVEVEFGTVLDDLEDEVAFERIYDVTGAADLSVTVTPTGVVVAGTRYEEDVYGEENNSTFEDLFGPQGAYDEVTAEYDEENATLTVSLFKVAPEGTTVEIDGWDVY